MDTPPIENIVPSVTLVEDVDVKETTADVTEEVQESPDPAVLKPPHTSPDISFASEVTSQIVIYSNRTWSNYQWKPININSMHPLMQGLLRIILLEAQSLVAKDNMMGGMVKGKSDPYAKISVGKLEFKSRVIKENLNPVWNEMYEVCMKDCACCFALITIWCLFNGSHFPQVVLRPQPGQEQVHVELYDKDMDKDDFMGR